MAPSARARRSCPAGPAERGLCHASLYVLNRENAPVISAMVMASLIVLPTILLGSCVDDKIKAYYNQISEKELLRSHYLQMASYHLSRIQFYELAGLVASSQPRLTLTIDKDPVTKFADQEELVVRSRYQAGEIDTYQYFLEMGNIYRERKENDADNVRKLGDEIKGLHKTKPWAFLIKIGLTVFQLLGVLLVLLLNSWALRRKKSITTCEDDD